MRAVVTIWSVVIASLVLTAQVRTGTLTIHYIDTEGGQSTLFVGPTGESLLVDTGNAGDRDLGRIAETLRAAGVTKIDHLWTTHYHGDHVGALIELAKQFPVAHFYDHGKPHANDRIVSSQFLSAYESLSAGKRTISPARGARPSVKRCIRPPAWWEMCAVCAAQSAATRGATTKPCSASSMAGASRRDSSMVP